MLLTVVVEDDEGITRTMVSDLQRYSVSHGIVCKMVVTDLVEAGIIEGKKTVEECEEEALLCLDSTDVVVEGLPK